MTNYQYLIWEEPKDKDVIHIGKRWQVIGTKTIVTSHVATVNTDMLSEIMDEENLGRLWFALNNNRRGTPVEVELTLTCSHLIEE